MKRYKQILIQLPEYYLVALTILAALTLPLSLNPLVVGLAVVLTLQIIFKSKTVGFIIASLFLIANLFMLIALTTGLNEFPKFNANAKELLFGGLLLLGFNVFISALMFAKYSHKTHLSQFQTEPGHQ
jgi:hypothetical protein